MHVYFYDDMLVSQIISLAIYAVGLLLHAKKLCMHCVYTVVPCSCRHYPVGILYDLYGRGGNLPWEITVHFRVSVLLLPYDHL